MFTKGYHLTYCTNIHPGESWTKTFQNLKDFIPNIKQEVAGDQPFGIGLRLSNEASMELKHEEKLSEFKSWLKANSCYIFTFNGFPFGGFHRQVVKDEVHKPDWTTPERLAYTNRLFDILSSLLPEKMDGGISTSPLSYRYWFGDQNQLEDAYRKSTLNLAVVAEKLYNIQKETGKPLHLDIEPEPDGILENSREVIDYYRDWLVPVGGKYLMERLGISEREAEECLKEHIRICYDVCHFAVVFEKPEDVFQAFKSAGIKIGKIQISSALKIEIPNTVEEKEEIKNILLPFVESTYLHQVVGKAVSNGITSFRDLPAALANLQENNMEEWRIHFHVPVFLENYGKISSTQGDIKEVLKYIAKEQICNHLEVETYTWEVLPKSINLDLGGSIIRELKWVEENRSNS